MAVYSRFGVGATSVSTTTTTANLALISRGGGANDRYPDDSSNPFDVNTSTDIITVNETGYFLFLLQADVSWLSTNPGSADYFTVQLEEDTGSGFASRAWTASQYHNKANGSVCLTFCTDVTSGWDYRVRLSTTGPTVDIGGSLTIYRDGLADTTVAPADAQFLTLATDADLDNERVLTPGTGISGSDGGAGSTYTLNLDINGLTADASPDGAADYVATYDASAGTIKKVLLDDLPGGGGGGAPTDASYLVAASDSTLSDERVATSGEGVSVATTSSAGTATFNLNFPGLSTYTGAGSSDFICVYDNTAKEHKKLTWAELFRLRDAQDAASSSLAAEQAWPETLIGLAEHVNANITSGDLSGDLAADAEYILQDYLDNGTNAGLDDPNSRAAIFRAIQRLKRYQAIEDGGA